MPSWLISRWSLSNSPLSRKIVCLALLNLTLLGVVVVVFARSQFQFSPESLLLGPARDRIVAIADSFSLQLENTPANARDALFAAYARRYQADIFLTNPQGGLMIQSLATGPEIELPRELMDKLEREAPPPRRPRPPPPREGGDDGVRPMPPPREAAPSESAFLVITHNPTRYWAGARIPVRIPEFDDQRPGILLLRSSSLFNASLFFDWRLWIGVAVSLVGVSVLCWLPFVRGLTRSIGEMDRAARQIAEGRFDVQVESRRGDELGDLGRQIDQMAARLQSFVKNQKRFLGDIAHELCAPIARIQFALGILEQKAGDAQGADVATLHDEIQEMSGLVNELLSFSKAGMNPEAATVTAVPLALVVQRAIAREAFSGVQVEAHVPPGLMAMANEAHLARALSNLLRNAIRYAGVAGPITIGAKPEGSAVWLTVADCGPGLPEAELEEVFAPFYRPEASRTRESGGAGLGLAIVKSCVELCGGTVKCRNRQPSGLEVAIRLKGA
jgi:two-component system, OmpR family, sensor histidine kinase CpxA